MLQVMFADTSSPGLRASAGISVAWVGRTGAPAAPTTAASTYRRRVGPSAAITTATSAAATVRITPIPSMSRSPRNRSSMAPESIPETTAGIMRTAPSTLAATTPSRR